MAKYKLKTSNTSAYMQQQMELQLHEQYAVNNNSGMSSVTSILVGLFAAFGGYAYVLIHAVPSPSASCCIAAYNIQQVALATDGLLLVLALMTFLCMRQGFTQRMEQFITYAIRYKHYGTAFKKSFNQRKIYPCKYHPFGKTWRNAVQGIYNDLLPILLLCAVLALLVYLALAWDELSFNLPEGLLTASPLWLTALLYVALQWKYCVLLNKYHQREEEYKAINIFNNNVMKLLTITKSPTPGQNAIGTHTLCLGSINSVAEMDECAVFESGAYLKIFGERKNQASDARKRLSIVKITYGKQSIYRRFYSTSASGFTDDYVALTSHSMNLLAGQYKMGGKEVTVTPGCKLPFYWRHPNLAVRISVKLGILSVILGIISVALGILSLIQAV